MKAAFVALAMASALLCGCATRTDRTLTTMPNDTLYEMRTYYAEPGKLEALEARFRDHTVRLFHRHGMTSVGYWRPVENPENKLVYILAYPGQAAREAAWAQFRADPEWQAAKQASEADGALVARQESVFLTSTDYSPPIRAVAPR